MKICVINSSYEGTNSVFEAYDRLPDPSRYIPKSRHEFVTRYVTKANAKAEIDEIYNEGFDVFLNYMWGIESDNVAGLEATKYLESKGAILLTNPAYFLAKTKLDLQKAAGEYEVPTPQNTPGKFPKIVKYADGYGSIGLDENSICYTDDEVCQRMNFLRSYNQTFGDVVVQDFIVGKECSTLVVEMGREVVGLTPIEWVFPESTPPNQAFLTWDKKFNGVEDGIVKYAFLEDEPAQSRINAAAVQAFKALGVSGGGACARVDLRLEQKMGDAYVLEVNCIPPFFYPQEEPECVDLVIQEKFPGGHAAFFDMLLATKQIQLGYNLNKNNHVAGIYDRFAEKYHESRADTEFTKMQQFFAANYDFSGTVLDLACGTGAFGEILGARGVSAEITGMEVSEGMLESPCIKQFYKKPLLVGPMEELIMGAGEFDHIICFGAFHFLDTVHLNAFLARMFMLAQKSVTFEVDDLSDEYIDDIKRIHGDLCVNINHVRTVEKFGIPRKWKRVHNERVYLYKSPSTGTDVFGLAMRFEKV